MTMNSRLRKILSAENNSKFDLVTSICFQANLALSPKTKFVLHDMDYNFHLRSNLKTGIEPTVLL